MEVTEKECTKCKELRPLEEFYKLKRGKYGRVSWCKYCQQKRAKEHNNDPKNKHKLRKRYLKEKYDITPRQYTKMLDKQNWKCAICYKPAKDDKNLFVDHNHETGKVRGLLCSRCNTAIGLLCENKDNLERALYYLRVHNDDVTVLEYEEIDGYTVLPY